MEFLGLDVGEKMVGLAKADSELAIALPFKTLERKNGKAERELIVLIEELNIIKVIVGMPYSLDGSENKQCAKIKNFCRRLTQRVRIDITYVDEHLSTFETKQKLADSCSSMKRLKRKGAIDSISAAVILQTFLDAQKK